MGHVPGMRQTKNAYEILVGKPGWKNGLEDLGVGGRILLKLRFQALTAATMNMAGFCVVAPHNMVVVYRRFRGTFCLHHQGDDLIFLMMEDLW
jgi:hypothetical protein